MAGYICPECGEANPDETECPCGYVPGNETDDDDYVEIDTGE
jgi:hypothetical protein